MDLRRETVQALLTYRFVILKEFLGTLKEHHNGRPRYPGRDDLVPVVNEGPFTYLEYLEAQLKAGFRGDAACAFALSLMWNLRFTIIDDIWGEIRVRHNRPLREADIVLVFSYGVVVGQGHFSAAGELNF